MPDPTAQPLDTWAKLDLFGRQTAAGRVTEVKIGGTDFLRLHIPADGDGQARTIDYNPAAWSARRLIQQSSSQLALGTTYLDDEDDDEEDEDLD